MAVGCSMLNIQKSNDNITINQINCSRKLEDLKIDVTFPIYIIGLMSFISWFLFVLFGGIGLAALPLDHFYDFCTRPKALKPSEVEKRKKKILEESSSLKVLGNEIKAMEDKGVKTKFSKK
jgi:LMBR1 domain-containing protein 1